MLNEHKEKLESILKKQQKDIERGKQKLKEKDLKRKTALEDFEKKKAAEIKPAFGEILSVFQSYGRRDVHVTEENDRLPDYRPKYPPSVTFHLVSRAVAAENPHSLRFSLRLDADALTVAAWVSNRKKMIKQAEIALADVSGKWLQEQLVVYVENMLAAGNYLTVPGSG